MQLEMQRKHLNTQRIPTVGEFLEYWLHQVVKPLRRPNTFSGYSNNVRKHLAPALGIIKLDRLTPQQVQEMMNSKLASGLAPKTVVYVHQVLHTALECARKWEIIDRNVASLVDRPRRKRPNIHPLRPDEARNFLNSLRGHRLEALFSVAIAIGVREGEALGLAWDDIDLRDGVIKVRNQLQRIEGHLTLVEPKSPHSIRTLAVPASIMERLNDHAKGQLAEKLHAGSKWDDSGLVFTNRFGGPLQARNVIRELHTALKDAGIRRIRFQDLRHSCATLLLVQGVHPRVVMEILGHSDIAITMNTYSHVVPELQRDAAEKMDVLISGSKSGRSELER
jgi:integrase